MQLKSPKFGLPTENPLKMNCDLPVKVGYSKTKNVLAGS